MVAIASCVLASAVEAPEHFANEFYLRGLARSRMPPPLRQEVLPGRLAHFGVPCQVGSLFSQPGLLRSIWRLPWSFF